jgi:hypothetical protein
MVLLPDAGLANSQYTTHIVECRKNVRVDCTNHTGLAMLSLRAVEPHGLLVLDADGVGQDVRGSSERGVGGHETRKEGVCLVGHHVLDRNTGLVEGRLDDGVVLHALLVTNYHSSHVHVPWRGIGTE